MKRLVLVTSLSLMTVAAAAQRKAIEIGLGAGVSINSNPTYNMAYAGNRITPNYSALLNGLYNVNKYLSVGIEARVMELSRKSDSVYNTYLFTKIGGDDKRFTYSKAMISGSAIANGKLVVNRGYAYAGVAVGYALSRQNSQLLNANESYRAPDGGKGLYRSLLRRIAC